MQLQGPTAAGLMYSDTGGDGPVVVLLHGVLMGGSLWDTVTEGLRDRYRCIVPELPFGAHTTPMPDDADLSLPALASMIAEFLTELDVRHVTLVCNDWGGAQLVISPGGTDRVANLVLVSCEAFDNYRPELTAITDIPHPGVHPLGVRLLCAGRCETFSKGASREVVGVLRWPGGSTFRWVIGVILGQSNYRLKPVSLTRARRGAPLESICQRRPVVSTP